MKISVFGSGYVGLVASACVADVGHDVLCMDIDTQRIDLLNSGETPIHEPGLNMLMRSNMQAQRLFFSTDTAQAVAFADLDSGSNSNRRS